jgi:hypothetical protein
LSQDAEGASGTPGRVFGLMKAVDKFEYRRGYTFGLRRGAHHPYPCPYTLPEVSQQRRDELRTEPRTLTRGRIRPARVSRTFLAYPSAAKYRWVEGQ